jgi:antitoxin component of RelBE/YafQ-DinJ toxin-antitoxin module
MTDDYDRKPAIGARVEPEIDEAVREIADAAGLTVSRYVEMSLANSVETNRDLLEDKSKLERLNEEREEIVKQGREADKILGFPGRVEGRLETLFQDEWEPERLRDSMKSYYADAENLEQQAQEHPHIESVEPGEFVEAVDRALEETITAVHLSDWDERDRYEKFEGVESGKQAERQALALTRTMMRRDEDLDALRSLSDADPRVEAAHAPDAAVDEDLPAGVTVGDVAEKARLLVDEGLDPEDLPLDPVEFRRQTPEEALALLGEDVDEEAGEDVPEVESGAVTLETETDGGALEVASDGGDHLAVQAFDEDADDLEQGADDDRPDDPDEETETDGGPTVEDLVEETAEKLREAENYSSDAHTESYVEEKREKRRRTAEDRIRTAFESDTDNWRDELMADTDLTPDDLIDLADEYNDAIDEALRGEREDVPDVVVDENGGVSLE